MFTPPPAQASPWSRDQGGLMIITRADYFTSDLGLVSVGGVDVAGKFERIETNTYLEYGVTNSLTLGGKAFYGTSWLTRGGAVETASGFSEFEAFAQQQQLFRDARHAGAIKLTGGVPTDYQSGARPSLQSDGFDLEASALYGRTLSFNPVNSFAAVEIGYRKRFSASADQFRFLATIGVEPAKNWGLLLDVYSVKSLKNGRPGGADFDVLKLQPSIIWRASRRFSFQLGVSEEVAGRNLDPGRTYFIGVRTQF